jgi:hypothetical protein
MFGLNEKGRKENYGMNEFGQTTLLKNLDVNKKLIIKKKTKSTLFVLC